MKRRRCIAIDPDDLHWMLYGMADDDIRTAFAAFGNVTEVSRERWRVPGVKEKGSTTRTVLLKMKPGIKVDDLPHQLRVAGELALWLHLFALCSACASTAWATFGVNAMCLGSKCRRYGHVDIERVRTYAVATEPATRDESAELLIDVVEAEEAAKGAEEADKSAGTTVPSVPSSGDANTSTNAGKRPEEKKSPVTQAKTSENEESGPAARNAEPTNTLEKLNRGGGCTATVTASVKSPHVPTGNEGDKEAASGVEEPPAKTSQARRFSPRSRPNVPSERRAGGTTPTLQGSASAPDGSGINKGV